MESRLYNTSKTQVMGEMLIEIKSKDTVLHHTIQTIVGSVNRRR